MTKEWCALVLRHRGIKERDPLEGGMYRNSCRRAREKRSNMRQLCQRALLRD